MPLGQESVNDRYNGNAGMFFHTRTSESTHVGIGDSEPSSGVTTADIRIRTARLCAQVLRLNLNSL
jgi:hypothetical protein